MHNEELNVQMHHPTSTVEQFVKKKVFTSIDKNEKNEENKENKENNNNKDNKDYEPFDCVTCYAEDCTKGYMVLCCGQRVCMECANNYANILVRCHDCIDVDTITTHDVIPEFICPYCRTVFELENPVGSVLDTELAFDEMDEVD
jgi:hypothetical protein